VGQEKIGVIDENTIKAVGAFGGGIASSGNVCGILLGGISVISTIYSRGNLDEKENPRVWGMSSKFFKRFEELAMPLGGIDCIEIAKVDWRNRSEVKKYYSDPDSTHKVCVKLVGDAAYALGELIDLHLKKE
jgi:C_GCAxxG_C_C family probable redox protein